MIKILTITYEKVNEDIPIMYIEESGLLSNTPSKIFTFTGEKAEQLYKELTGWTERRDKNK